MVEMLTSCLQILALPMAALLLAFVARGILLFLPSFILCKGRAFLALALAKVGYATVAVIASYLITLPLKLLPILAGSNASAAGSIWRFAWLAGMAIIVSEIATTLYYRKMPVRRHFQEGIALSIYFLFWAWGLDVLTHVCWQPGRFSLPAYFSGNALSWAILAWMMAIAGLLVAAFRSRRTHRLRAASPLR